MSQQSPYVSSACVPQCIAKDDSSLILTARKICLHNTISKGVLPVKVPIINFIGQAALDASITLKQSASGSLVLLNSVAATNARIINLPEATQDNIGTTFQFAVLKNSTHANGYALTTATTADKIKGAVTLAAGAVGVVAGGRVAATASADSMRLTGLTSGNAAGSFGTLVRLTITDKDTWTVSGVAATLHNAGTGSAIFA